MRHQNNQQIKRESRETARDVGRHQHTQAIERKKRYQNDLLAFIADCFRQAVPLAMSDAHLVFIRQLQDSILHGGTYAVALPRGYGKTTIIVIAAIWALLYGHRRYVAVIAATGKDAYKIIVSIKRHLERNEDLAELFPEVCHYVRALDGQTQRANGQLADGNLTGIVWRTDLLVMPQGGNDPEYLEFAGQAVVEARGMTGSIRGLQYTTTSGEILRPEFILLDDPQTRESAKSAEQTNSRIALIDGDIMGCAGPTVELAAAMACTVIEDNDLSEHYLAEWSSVRTGLVTSWPTDEEAFAHYRERYNDVKRQPKEEQTRKLNTYYIDNRAELETGAAVSWSERITGGALTALQTAYNLRCKLGDSAFFAEYQNQPLRQNTTLYTLSTRLVESRINHLAHRQIPDGYPLLVCAADVNYYAISYVVLAVRSDFAASIVDYGWFPDSGCVYDAKSSLIPEEAAIYAALDAFARQIKLAHPALSILGIDGNRFTAPVYKFVQANSSAYAARMIPLRGMASTQYKEPSAGTSGVVGSPRTRCCVKTGRDNVAAAPFDSYYWHAFGQKMWLLPPGAPGSVSIYGNESIDHRRFAEQIYADKLLDYYTRLGEVVYKWKTVGENEMSDCLTMALVLANLAGVEPGGISATVRTVKKKVRRAPTITRI